MVALLMWGAGPPHEEHSIVTIFGWSLGGFIVAMIAVIVGLLAGGPVGRFKVAAGRDGATHRSGSPAGEARMIPRFLTSRACSASPPRCCCSGCS